MNCAERLVEIFGSQAELARAFQLDRAVVHNWVKVGYVPARWAGEVERLTQGRISAVEVINEASAKNPVRVKSRPGDAPFGILSETDPMNQYAPAKRIYSFHPPQRTLMGPGPTEIHPRVLTTMSQPAIGYLDPVFVEMMEELKSLLRYVYQTKNPLTFPLSGPGSVGMEYCFVNLVAPGDKVIVCQNGVFGGRMLENAARCGGSPVVVEDKWGEPVDPQKLEDALKKNRDAKLVAFVHAETSTGCQSDAKLLTQIAHKHGALVIVDAVTSLGGTPGELLGAPLAPPLRIEGRPGSNGNEILGCRKRSVAADECRAVSRGRGRSQGAQHAAHRVRPRDRRRPRAAQGQDLALRPDGLQLPPGQRDAVPLGARLGAQRHGAAGACRRRRGRGARRLRPDARQGRTAQEESCLKSGSEPGRLVVIDGGARKGPRQTELRTGIDELPVRHEMRV